MKSARPEPTSYKNFIEQLSKNNPKQSNPANTCPERKKIKIKNKITQSTSIENAVHSKSTSICQKSLQNRFNEEIYLEPKSVSHNQSLTHRQQNKKQLSAKGQNLSYRKFINEITTILAQVMKLKNPEFLNHRISYIEFLEVLKALKMIKGSYEPYPNDIVTELWTELITGNNIGNMIIVISVILGFQFENVNQNDKEIKDKYEILKYTRLQLSKRKITEQQQHSFTPQISQRSQELAKSKSKSKDKSLRHIKCVEIDRIHTSMSAVSGSKTQIEEYDENKCINSRQLIGSSLDKTGNKRSQILYRMAKLKSAEKRKDKSADEIQFEKNRGEMTLKPKINPYKGRENKQQIKGQKTIISRMIKARVEREVLKNIEQKGLPYNEKTVEKLKKRKYQEIITSLATEEDEQKKENLQTEKQLKEDIPKISYTDLKVDVYIAEDYKEELIVEKGDSLVEVAKKFIIQHKISEQKLEQLIDLLQKSMKHVLLPIDEMAEEEQQELLSARGCPTNPFPY